MIVLNKCPLCDSSKYIIKRSISVDKIKSSWDKNYSYSIIGKHKLTNVSVVELCQCSECKLQFYTPAFFGDSQFYEMLSKEPWYYEENKWEYECAIENMLNFEAIRSVLEIGSGCGFFLKKISKIFDASGLELNKDSAEKSRQAGLNVSIKSIENISQKYDAICLFQVLEHIDSPLHFLNATVKALNDNGILILSVPNPSGFLADIDFDPLDMPPHHFTRWSKKSFEYISKKWGLKIIAIQNEPLRYVHFLWLLKNYSNASSNKNIVTRKITSFVIEVLSPLLYLSQKNTIEGHSHLIVFQKTIG